MKRLGWEAPRAMFEERYPAAKIAPRPGCGLHARGARALPSCIEESPSFRGPGAIMFVFSNVAQVIMQFPARAVTISHGRGTY